MEPRFNFTVAALVASGRLTHGEVEELKRWLQTQDFPEITEEQIALFLLACDRDFAATTATVRAHFASKLSVEDFFSGRDVDGEDVQSQLRISDFAVLPARTATGAAILYFRLKKRPYYLLDLVSIMKLWFMVLESILCEDPPTGLIILVDAEGLSLMHLTKARLGPLRNFFYYLQEGLPLKLRQIQVLNAVYFMDKVMAILKPFMKKELINMIKFNPPNMDLREFHKTIPPQCLPQELGGELACVETLKEKTIEKLRELKISYFQPEEEQRIRFKQRKKHFV